MALVYKRSDEKAARAYDRSKGMEPNGGVSALTVVSNPKRRTSRGVKDNPFQWIEGRGQRHRHVSPQYQSLRRAKGWKKKNKGSTKARLYPVDERGTIVSRPLDSRLLDNGGSEMPYNIGALRRAMRSNPKKRVRSNRTKGGVKVKARGKRRTTRNKKRSTVRRKSRAPKRNAKRRTSRKPKRNSRRRAGRRRSSKRRSSKRRSRRNSRRRSSRKPKRNSRRRASKRRSRRRSSRKPKRNSRRRASKRRSSKRRAPRRNSRRRSSRKPRRNRGVRSSSKRRGTKRRRTSKKKSRAKYFGKRKVGLTGAEYIDKYLEKGLLPTVAPRYRTGKSRSGIPPVLVYPIGKKKGRLSKRKTSRSTKSRRGPRKRKRATSVGASYKGNRKRKIKANRRRSRRSSRRRSTRRNSRRRSSRRVRKNLLSTTKARWGGRGKHRKGRPVGKTVQVLAYGPGSRTKSGGKLKGYPVFIPGHVIETAAVRRYKGLGGAAKDSHRRAQRRGYRERKKYVKRRPKKNSRRTSMRKNRRKSRRKSTRRNSRRRSSRRRSRRRSRRNPKYVTANRRRRRRRRSSKRRVRRNQGIYGADIMKDVVTPVLGGTVGFVSARVLSNGLANVEGLRNVLDKDKPAAEATNTKIAANVLGIVATLGLAPKVEVIKRNQGSLITGMGLALTDRLLGMVTGDAAAYLGEYVSQPLGEYVSQPLGSFGEYVSQPLGNAMYATAGLGMPTMEAAAGMGMPAMQATAGYHEGVDPGNQAGVDGMMNSMEGAMYATAGMGETLYAAAGLGAEADAELESMYASEQPPFASIQTPTDMARSVSKGQPYADPVPSTLVTPEGKGYAGGLFARNLFAGML